MGKTAVLFSGGKDSMLALMLAKKAGHADLLISTVSSAGGDTQLHLAPEVSPVARKTQIALLKMPYQQVVINPQDNYLWQVFQELRSIVRSEGLTELVTGDLWNPYTGGLNDMLAGALNVKLWRPCRELCPSQEKSSEYMQKIIESGIEAVVVAVKKDILPYKYVGKKIDAKFLEEIQEQKSDCAGEEGQYQSFVVNSPLMKGKIQFGDFSVYEVSARNGRGTFYRLDTSDILSVSL